ncbi:MAG: hypothetical protein V3V08_05220 [Nannocystaceae bacterium]
MLRPSLGLDLHAGYRLTRWLTAGGEFTLTTRMTGLRDQELERVRRRSFLVSAGLWLPLGRHDVGVGLGVGSSSLGLRFDSQAVFQSLEYRGLALRPALVYRRWILADYAVGLRVVGFLDTNAEICLTSGGGQRTCPEDLGPVPHAYREVYYRGVLLGLEMTGSAVLY